MFKFLRDMKFLIGALAVFILIYSGGEPINFLQEKTYWVADKVNEGLEWLKSSQIYNFLITMKKGFVNLDLLEKTKNKTEETIIDFMDNPKKSDVDTVKVFDKDSKKSWQPIQENE